VRKGWTARAFADTADLGKENFIQSLVPWEARVPRRDRLHRHRFFHVFACDPRDTSTRKSARCWASVGRRRAWRYRESWTLPVGVSWLSGSPERPAAGIRPLASRGGAPNVPQRRRALSSQSFPTAAVKAPRQPTF